MTIRVTARNNVNGTQIMVDSEKTLSEVIAEVENEGIHLNQGSLQLNGAVVGVEDLNKTMEELGFGEMGKSNVTLMAVENLKNANK